MSQCKVFSFLLIAFSLVSCQFWDSNNNKTGSSEATSELNRATTGFNFFMPLLQQQTLSESNSRQVQRFPTNNTIDQIITGEMTVTNKTNSQTEKYNWSVYLNETDFSVQSNKSIVLGAAAYDFQLILTKGNQQYIGSVSNFNIVDGTNNVPMIIRPVIGDNITDVNLLDKVGTIQFQYDKNELAKLTVPKLGVAIDGDTEIIYAVDPTTGLINNYFNLSEGEHTVVLKLYDGDTQLAKSKPAQETFNVTLGNNVTMDLIPLEGETSFTLTTNGGSAKFKLSLPSVLITEVGGKDNLSAQMTVVGPKNPIRELSLSVNSTIDESGDSLFFVETTLDNYHYDTVSYTVTFSDLNKTPQEELAKCVQDNLTLDANSRATACSITLQRRGIATGNLYGMLGINAFNTEQEALAGVKIRANGAFIGITGTGTFGTPGYLKHRIAKGNYTIKAEDIGTVESDVTIDSLELKNIDLILNQNMTWTFVDGDGENGLNRDPTQAALGSVLTTLNNKLYAAWYEHNGVAYQLRMVVYNGDDQTPTWKFVDGNGTDGINKNLEHDSYGPPAMINFNNKLYTTWNESKGTPGQLRMAVYNGNDDAPSWSFVDGNGSSGINKDPAQNTTGPRLNAFNNKLYMTWYEHNGTSYQIRVAVYNSDDLTPTWKFVDGNGTDGLNKNPGQNAYLPQVIEFNNKLYVLWSEFDGSQYQFRMALYNGNDDSPAWSLIEGNIQNRSDNDPQGSIKQVQAVAFNGKMYSLWREDHDSMRRCYAAVYSGDDSSPAWSLVNNNSEALFRQDCRQPRFIVFNNRLHVIWRQVDQDRNLIRIAVYNGDDTSPYWRPVNGVDSLGINKNKEHSAAGPKLKVFNNKLYATWREEYGGIWQTRVAVGSYQ